MATCNECLHIEVCVRCCSLQSEEGCSTCMLGLCRYDNIAEECKFFERKTEYAKVVRCKDCRHYSHFGRTSLLVNGRNVQAGWCQRRIRYDEEHRMLPDDFCSYGERKEVEGE